jgi:hypothetical protein
LLRFLDSLAHLGDHRQKPRGEDQMARRQFHRADARLHDCHGAEQDRGEVLVGDREEGIGALAHEGGESPSWSCVEGNNHAFLTGSLGFLLHVAGGKLPELRRFVLANTIKGHMTVPRLVSVSCFGMQ